MIMSRFCNAGNCGVEGCDISKAQQNSFVFILFYDGTFLSMSKLYFFIPI